jgi:DNA modification methylase
MSQTYTVHTGDVRAVVQTLPREHYHAALCDPPYEYSFMGAKWDSSGIAFDPTWWAALAATLKPGGILMAFASSRGWHRLACAIEDAGLVLYPSVFLWSYASGFPKATRLDKRLDAQAGAERSPKTYHKSGVRGQCYAHDQWTLAHWGKVDVSEPVTPIARAWAGHRYGGQAIKPAVEPIIVALKPYARGGTLASIVEHGAGAFNIDAARIAYEAGGSQASNPSKRSHINAGNGGHIISTETERRVVMPDQHGRWPANFVLQHSQACTESDCAEDCAARALNEQTGVLASGQPGGVRKVGNQIVYAPDGTRLGSAVTGYGDAGYASRFYHQADWSLEVQEQVERAEAVFYCAKASRAERDAGLAALPEREMRRVNRGGLEHDPKFAPYPARNIHPTVKPLSLTRWLASLLLPPDAYAPRSIIHPFAGSGSEMIGALLAGFEQITGIEQQPDFVEIAQARLHYWQQRATPRTRAQRKIKASQPAAADALPLFGPPAE